MLLFDALEAINQRYNHLNVPQNIPIEAPVNREGQIDDIRLYNRALNDTEITYLATH